MSDTSKSRVLLAAATLVTAATATPLHATTTKPGLLNRIHAVRAAALNGDEAYQATPEHKGAAPTLMSQNFSNTFNKAPECGSKC